MDCQELPHGARKRAFSRCCCLDKQGQGAFLTPEGRFSGSILTPWDDV